jgi:hypothetical protein
MMHQSVMIDDESAARPDRFLNILLRLRLRACVPVPVPVPSPWRPLSLIKPLPACPAAASVLHLWCQLTRITSKITRLAGYSIDRGTIHPARSAILISPNANPL